MASFNFFGSPAAETFADDPATIGGVVVIGEGVGRTVKPPAGPLRTVAKIANGAGAVLTDGERSDLDILGITLEPASDDDRTRAMNSMIAEGKHQFEAINFAMSMVKAAEPVRITNWFRRA